MPELNPISLPKLVAARKSSKTSLDMAIDPSASLYSCTDSGFFSGSEGSAPPTPGQSGRGHLRFPSSTSSLSSSPPNHASFELPNASGKLPKLTEEPVERDDLPMLDRFSYDNSLAERDQCMTDVPEFGAPFDYDASDVLDSDLHLAKRRRSGDPPIQSFADRMEQRFPSLTRIRERKRASTMGTTIRSAPTSGAPSRVPSRAASTRMSTRSSSLTSSVVQLHESSAMPISARSSREAVNQMTPVPVDTPADEVEDDIPKCFATTPLLPPLLVKARDNVPTQSPLQSPTIGEPNSSLAVTPIGTPPFRAYPTPPLSTRPSVASFHRTQTGSQLVPASDIPPIMLTEPNDKWADKLGHANFTIQPEPYMPEVCDAASVRQLFADWEQARCNFTKHLVRTGEHFGVTSKHYKLTEQKWAEIDAMWKASHDLVLAQATALGAEPEPTTPVEPAPLTPMPLINDPKGEGKFPQLGDEDIVGPMVQIAAQMQKSPSRKRAFIQFFKDMKFPGSFLRRSSGIPSH
ncbi:hypothetical protein M011DRAFT_265260 [Sporormia fimetaria CBS 119925]|uniref:Only prolin and serin are matching in the corresponding protein n=1 Tax=Sporormia fimetaria CBS 119925 TaxID=1340428 RepID=A0A6A6UXV0_9PLEO|nr:hypothetical protein M011DRAFT_265260 [Sporormia fimetaria CBS 119925]